MIRLFTRHDGVRPNHSAFTTLLRSYTESFGTIVVRRLSLTFVFNRPQSGAGTQQIKGERADKIVLRSVTFLPRKATYRCKPEIDTDNEISSFANLTAWMRKEVHSHEEITSA